MTLASRSSDAARRRAGRLQEDAEDAREFFERREQRRELATAAASVLPLPSRSCFVAELVGDLGQLEQLADGAAGVEVVVHRGEEFFAARGGGVESGIVDPAAEAALAVGRDEWAA